LVSAGDESTSAELGEIERKKRKLKPWRVKLLSRSGLSGFEHTSRRVDVMRLQKTDPNKKFTDDVSRGGDFKDRMVDKPRAVDFRFGR
jgi:hypothetical protein